MCAVKIIPIKKIMIVADQTLPAKPMIKESEPKNSMMITKNAIAWANEVFL